MTSLLQLMKPGRWLAHLPLAILPFLAAVVIEGRQLSRDVMERVDRKLVAAGHGWAGLEVGARDVVISGRAPSAAAAAEAVALAKATEGVRVVELRVSGTP